MPLICLCIDCDAYFFVFQNLLPNPTDQNVVQIIVQLTIRLILVTHMTAEIFRLISYLIVCFSIYLQGVTNILNFFKTSVENGISHKYFSCLYTQFYLIFNVTQDRLHQTMNLVITSDFWATVVILWSATKGCGLTDNMIYIWVVLFAIVIVGGTVIFFQLVTEIHNLSSSQLKKTELDVLHKMVSKRTIQLQWELKEMKNLKQIKLRCGRCFDLDCGSEAVYFMKLTDTWLSAVLLFN